MFYFTTVLNKGLVLRFVVVVKIMYPPAFLRIGSYMYATDGYP